MRNFIDKLTNSLTHYILPSQDLTVKFILVQKGRDLSDGLILT